MIKKDIGKSKNGINIPSTKFGETIESKVERIMNQNAPITDGAPIIFTDRKDGIKPEYDIRTDRFEIAQDAMDKIAATKAAQRQQRIKDREPVKTENTQGTNGGQPAA